MKRIKQAAAKVMIAGALSATVVVGTAGIASAVGRGETTDGIGPTWQAAYDQAQSMCDSRKILNVINSGKIGDDYYVTAACA